MIIEARAVPPFFKNGFVVACEQSQEGVLIDPGDEVDDLLHVVQQRQLAIRYILLTHAHVDHVSGVSKGKQTLGAPVCLHPGDRVLYAAAPEQARLFGFEIDPLPPIDFFYDGPGPWRFGEYEAVVHETPGHCPGGVCLQIGPRGTPGLDLFVGDTLFAGSVGRTDLPGGDTSTLMRSIRQVLFSFPDESVVYPGHGPTTTIGHEKRTNPFLVTVS